MNVWNAPRSPFDLVQEPYFGDDWKILVCCQLLNMTTHVQVRKVLPVLFGEWANAEAMANAMARASMARANAHALEIAMASASAKANNRLEL